MVLGKTGVAIAEGLLQIKDVGVKAAVKETVVKASKATLGRDIAKQFTNNPKTLAGSSYAAAYVVLISSFLYFCSSKNEDAARKELVLRGLIKLEDL
jgi:hypothetical protein